MSQFSNRVQFNWGYHDAAQAVREGWAIPERNFGFANVGALANLTSVTDVVIRHPNRVYVQGWQHGYQDAKDGFYEGNSEQAWGRALTLGQVTE